VGLPDFVLCGDGTVKVSHLDYDEVELLNQQYFQYQ